MAATAACAALLVVGLAGKGSDGKLHLAPALPHQDLVAPSITLADLRGHPAFVTFWASWCGPCASEAPALEHFSQTLAGRGRLVGVDWTDGLAGARSFIREHHWTFSSLRDSSGDVGRKYGITGLPTTFVLDARGHLSGTLRGPQTAQRLNRALAQVSRG
jgi:cytochrome c biogenesis protein CcmG, thiol:disulfide interchange protein DsbE